VAIRGSLFASPGNFLASEHAWSCPRVNGDLVNPRGLVPGRDKEEGANLIKIHPAPASFPT